MRWRTLGEIKRGLGRGLDLFCVWGVWVGVFTSFGGFIGLGLRLSSSGPSNSSTSYSNTSRPRYDYVFSPNAKPSYSPNPQY